jgi:sugar phosphate permease
MFTSQESTGSGYTTTMAYLAGAVFSPLIVVLSRPVGYTAISLAIVGSALCVTLAWVNWEKSSQRSTPSADTQKELAK